MNDNRRAPQHNLERERAAWTEKKISAGVVAQRLHAIGKTSRYFRMKDCADTIISDVCEKCEARYVINTNFCRDRLCPLCSWRRSRLLAQRLGEIIMENETEKPSRYISLTLTVRNVPWSELPGQIEAIMEAWRRMDKRIKRAASVTGWARAFEVTRSKKHGDAHPHFHVLLQVPPEYFEPAYKADKVDKSAGLHYHKKDELIEQWRECLRSEYSPSISINVVKDTEHDMRRALWELARYIVKGTDVSGLSDADFKYYAEAVRGVHSWATGGRMRILDKSDDEIEPPESQSSQGGVCRYCGGKLYEMREVWSSERKHYTMKSDMSYNHLINQAHVVNLNINSGGGNVYVGSEVCGRHAKRTKRTKHAGKRESGIG